MVDAVAINIPALVLLTITASVQPALPDAPIAKPAVTRPVTNGQFFDKPAKIAFAANMTLLAADSAQTCHNLANGGRERFLPTQSCAGATAIMGAEMGALWLGANLAHKLGHHKIERIAEWVMPTVNIRAIIYSHQHGGL